MVRSGRAEVLGEASTSVAQEAQVSYERPDRQALRQYGEEDDTVGHREELMANWKLASTGRKPKRIEPLE